MPLIIGDQPQPQSLRARFAQDADAAVSASIEKMPAIVTIRSNNSIHIEGDFTVVDADGKPFDLAGRTKIGLCRCGASENKPFCDGSHRKVNFQSVCEARALPPPAPKP